MPQGTELHIPFPPGISPDHDAARERNIAWVRDMGLVGSDESMERYRSWRVAELAARTNPRATGDDLDLICGVLSLAFLFDDQFDGPLGWQPDRASGVCGAMISVIDGSPIAPEYEGTPLVRSWKDLWQRTVPGMSDDWRSRAGRNFAANYSVYVQEAENRHGGTPPPLDVYLDMRQKSVDMHPLLDMVERVGHFELTPAEYYSPHVQEVRRIAADVIAFNNDISSLEKESMRGDPHNLVLVLMREMRCSQQDAIQEISAMVRTRIERLRVLESQFQRSPAGTGRAALQRDHRELFLDGVHAWIRGCYDWEATTDRYAVHTATSAHEPGFSEDLISPRCQVRR
ncbi:terpene synthase family protein [Wenjunlia tyrosinilytica]|uniref:Terpene synthase n=1 Tax=Wenjunlia tyrosinilytica TaxID=1544741 RepID=A0A917ZLZ5_9ACTN|nr:hypothetical protein [Wenjunlia tyrosinilytica]GGO84774.1 hypothetical protein GCM10012280_17020 [Wenjunlia tyrosinilytica]